MTKENNDYSLGFCWNPYIQSPKMFTIWADWFFIKHGDDKACGLEEDYYCQGIAEYPFLEGGESENEIPTGVDITYCSFMEHKFYAAEIDFTDEQKQLLTKKFKKGYHTSNYDGAITSFGMFSVVVIPGGKLRFALVAEERTEMLEFSYQVEEFDFNNPEIAWEAMNPDSQLYKAHKNFDKFFDQSLWEGDYYKELDEIKEEYGPDVYKRCKTYREKTIPLDIWDRYFRRYNYKVELTSEDHRNVADIDAQYFSNGERVVRNLTINPDNIIENPTCICQHIVKWHNTENKSFVFFTYFDEDETLDVLETASAKHPDVDGVLNLTLGKDGKSFRAAFLFGDETYKLEKTQLEVRDEEGNVIFKNFKGKVKEFKAM